MALLQAGGEDSLTVVVEMLVQEDGSVRARLAESSGNEEYDQAAVVATEEKRFAPAPGNEERRPVIAPFAWNHGH